jgi:pyridoxal phosphate enzyme (YggS family)
MELDNSNCALRENLDSVRTLIASACSQNGRPSETVTLIAASKTVPIARIQSAIDLGQRVFGENRVQESYEKWPTLLDANSGVELHLIGPLQSNKARDAVALFDVIQSVDRLSVAKSLAREQDKQGRRPRIYVQVNTGREAQKGGAMPEETGCLIRMCRDGYALDVVGLMCIPPAVGDPSADFDLLRKIAADEGISVIWMGMSGDYVQAIKHGATHVRVGSAIFGARLAQKP